MKKIYFAGKFNKKKAKDISLEEALIDDFRSKLLANPKLLTTYQDNLIINNKFQYLGPFYCEQASNGNFTSTDCNDVLNAEYEFVQKSDIFVVVFSESFSVGSVVELGWALNSDKKIIILYQEEDSCYTIKSEYWFAIADAIKKSPNLLIRKYKNYSDISPLIQQILEKEI